MGGISGVLLIGLVVMFVGIGPSYTALFFDMVSMYLVCGIIFGVLLVAFGLNGLEVVYRYMFQRVFYNTCCHNTKDLCIALHVFDLGFRTSILAGTLCSLLAFIKTLSGGMTDPGALTAGMAVALLTMFYGTLFAVLFAALHGRARAAQLENGQLEDSQPPRRGQQQDQRKVESAAGNPQSDAQSTSFTGILWLMPMTTLFMMIMLLFFLLIPLARELKLAGNSDPQAAALKPATCPPVPGARKDAVRDKIPANQE